MEIPLLQDIVIIFGLAVIVLWLCHRLRIPTIVGFLLTGILCGPHGFALVDGVQDVETLAQIGIMLLLFTIGLEFSLKKLYEIRRYFFIGGIIQVGSTVLLGFLVAKYLQRPTGEALFLGFLISLSSTAIVLKMLETQNETDTPQGKVSIGILIFQDIIAVPMMLLTPELAESEQATFDLDLLIRLLFGLAVIGIVFLASIKLIPQLLYQLAKVRSRELFSLSVLTICFAVAWLSASIGLSLAIGAFLAGLIISETEYRHEVVGNILPLQDIFASLFFVSIGMVLDVRFVLQNPLLILLITLAIILAKSLIVAFTTFCLGLPLRVMIVAGLALGQIGEFSFVLAKTGYDYKISTEYYYQLFLAVALFSMALTPWLMSASNSILLLLSRLPLPSRLSAGLKEVHYKTKMPHKDHVVIIGFGIAGRHLAQASKEAKLEYLIVEMNPDTVRTEKKKGEPILFGDASHDIVLKHLNIEHAKVVALMINDANAARRIVPLVKKLNPTSYLIVRTHFLKEMDLMYHLGADEVIPDEFGTSVEIFTRVLQKYNVPSEKIHDFVGRLRESGYEILHHTF